MARGDQDQKYDTTSQEKYFGKTVENTQVAPTGNYNEIIEDAENVSRVKETFKKTVGRTTSALYKRTLKTAVDSDIVKQFLDPFYMTRKVNKDFLYNNTDKLQELVTTTLTTDEVQNLLDYDDEDAKEKLRDKVTEMTLNGLNKAKNLVTPDGSTFAPDFEDWDMDTDMKLQFKDAYDINEGKIMKFLKEVAGGGLGMAADPVGLMAYGIPASFTATGVRGFMMKAGGFGAVGALDTAFIKGEREGYKNVGVEDLVQGFLGGSLSYIGLEGALKGIKLGGKGISKLTTKSPKGTPSTLAEQMDQNTPLDSLEIASDFRTEKTDIKFNDESFAPEAPETEQVITALNKKGDKLETQAVTGEFKTSTASEIMTQTGTKVSKDGYNYEVINGEKIENFGEPATNEQFNKIADTTTTKFKESYKQTIEDARQFTSDRIGGISASTESLHKQFSKPLRLTREQNPKIFNQINKDRNFLNEVVTRIYSEESTIIDPKYRDGQVFVDVLREINKTIPEIYNSNNVPLATMENFQQKFNYSPHRLGKKVNGVAARERFTDSHMKFLDYERIQKHERDLIQKKINNLKQQKATEKLQKKIVDLEEKLELKKKPMTAKEKRAYAEGIYNDARDLTQNRNRYNRSTTPNIERKALFYKPDKYLDAFEMWGKNGENFFDAFDDHLGIKASELAVFRILGVHPERTLNAMLDHFEPVKPTYNNVFSEAALSSLPTNFYKVLENMRDSIASGNISTAKNGVAVELLNSLLVIPRAKALNASFLYSPFEEMLYRGTRNNKKAFKKSEFGSTLNSINSTFQKLTPEQKVDFGMGMQDNIHRGYDAMNNNLLKKGSVAVADFVMTPQKLWSARNKKQAAYNFSAFMNDTLVKKKWSEISPDQQKMMRFMSIDEKLFNFAKENLSKTQETVRNNYGSRKIVNYNKLYSDSIRSGDRLTADKAMRMIEAQEQFIDINVPESDIVRRNLYQGNQAIRAGIVNTINNLSPFVLFKNSPLQISYLNAEMHGTYWQGIYDSAQSGHLKAMQNLIGNISMMLFAGFAFHNTKQALQGRQTDFEKFFFDDDYKIEGIEVYKDLTQYTIASGGMGIIGDLGMHIVSSIALSMWSQGKLTTQLRKQYILGETGSMLFSYPVAIVETANALLDGVATGNPHAIRRIRQAFPTYTPYDAALNVLGMRYLTDQLQISVDGEDDAARDFKRRNKAAAANGNAFRKDFQYGASENKAGQAIEEFFGGSN